MQDQFQLPGAAYIGSRRKVCHSGLPTFFAGLVSRFRSSSHFAELRFELRNRKDTSELIDPVWLWLRNPHD
jgi:hypothetical protein